MWLRYIHKQWLTCVCETFAGCWKLRTWRPYWNVRLRKLLTSLLNVTHSDVAAVNVWIKTVVSVCYLEYTNSMLLSKFHKFLSFLWRHIPGDITNCHTCAVRTWRSKFPSEFSIITWQKCALVTPSDKHKPLAVSQNFIYQFSIGTEAVLKDSISPWIMTLFNCRHYRHLGCDELHTGRNPPYIRRSEHTLYKG
jgi:hypothetical protein